MTDTFAEWQKDASRDRKSVDVCFDRALVSELEEAKAELARLRDEGMLEAPDGLQEKVDQLKAEVESKTRKVTFENIGRQKWRSLIGDHPPSEEQKRGGLDHNPETFAPVAIAATCVVPGLTEDQAEWMLNELPLRKANEVWNTCLAANILGADEKKALASASLLPIAKRSRLPSSSASPEAFSSDE